MGKWCGKTAFGVAVRIRLDQKYKICYSVTKPGQTLQKAGVRMQSIVECIPNFSEGRDAHTLAALAEAAQSVPGVMLLDYSADADHGRSVYTLAGSEAGVEQAAFRLCEVAVQRIDLRQHRGEHPRMGAVDVLPFVPIRGVTMAQCVALSQRVGRRIGEELGVPVMLYEESATAPHRKNLANIRHGGFEAMAEKLQEAAWMPDFGPAAPHKTAGAVAVGARGPLVAYNITLSTGDVAVAKEIAKAVRGSSGGFSHCKALGMMLHQKGCAQVSMNLVDYTKTPIYEVFDAVCREAEKRGVQVTGSEIIGLAPARALVDCAAHYLLLNGFDAERQVLENHFL